MPGETLTSHSTRRLTAMVVVLIASLAGCGSTYSGLPSERDVEPTASLIIAHDRVRYQTTLHETTRDGEPVIRIAIHTAGRGDRALKLVFVHGVFSDSETWRYLVPSLVDDYDLWFVDLPGCGKSDAPNPASLRSDGYTPHAMAERILQALEGRLLDEPEGTRLVVVAHSLGGATAIRMLADPAWQGRFSSVLDRVDRAVLIAPLHVAQNHAHANIRRIATVGGVLIGLGNTVGYVREQCAVNTIRGYGDTRYAVREEADKRCEILTDPARRRAMQAQLLQAVAFDADFIPKWDEMDRQTSIYANFNTPSVILWGSWDEVQPVSTGYLLAHELRGSELMIVRGAKHSVQMERASWVGEVIRAFVSGSTIPEPPNPHIPVSG